MFRCSPVLTIVVYLLLQMRQPFASGKQPGSYVLEQGELREHLLKCLEAGEFQMFPVRKARRLTMRIKSTETMKVYCDCRMPELLSSGLVQCTKCRGRYHSLCANIGPLQLKTKWICYSCGGGSP